jgi:hypothetical protein
LQQGLLVRGDRKRPSVECCYFDPAGIPFAAAKVAIKVTATRQAYVTTFHRLTVTEVRRIYRRALRRGALVRGLKKELAQLLAAPVT